MSVWAAAGLSILICVTLFALFTYAFRIGWIRFERFDPSKPVDLTKASWLLDEIKAERYALYEDLAEANRKIRKLENSEIALRQRIEELETELGSYRRRDDLPTTPLLLVCGDSDFCAQDTTQLNKARVWYRTLENATKAEISEELSRRRQNRDLYPWIHIAAHGNKDGILLADGVSSPTWWNSQLEGVKVIFAANCESVEVGDSLAGLVDFVVVFYGDRGTEDIARFTYSFWSEMMRNSDVRSAYKTSLTNVPQLRPFVDLRTR